MMTNLERIGFIFIGFAASILPAFFLMVLTNSTLPMMMVPICAWLGWRNAESIEAWLEAKS